LSAANPQQHSVLLVDDQENDIILTQIGLKRAGLTLPVHTVPGGVEAIAYLNGDPPYHDRALYPLPAAVLLDISMAHVDGFEVLGWIRQQPRFENLTVIMLTGSSATIDEESAHLLGATEFFVKSTDFSNAGELSSAIQRLIGMSRT
jgi:CheY-like chemotaxis protein